MAVPTASSRFAAVCAHGPTTGWVDGGWWPRSRDLAAELPGLQRPRHRHSARSRRGE
ncbi:DUF5994 family protein [Pseudonocardia charpentierae]|uniref:DUF5994 family protein n=1 Tax=Pseudonocardia charpentierae TaxID=3075545 RepID=A0ABU2NIK2_9PSEU|nr:DUF5994 family protein [Pseudonocardia sp. DSM 45834]MDT0352853.1 DUF5994 family protein [Pseudonocardia sp. DSM 45834]